MTELGLRVLVCGGRDFDNRRLVQATLRGLHEQTPIGCIIEGGARGADWLGKQWARQNRVATICVEANWNGFGKRAGHIRNGWMLSYCQPHLVVAFPGGRGTANMIEQATAAGVKVMEVQL